MIKLLFQLLFIKLYHVILFIWSFFLFTLAWQATFAKYKYRSKNSYCLQMTDEN